MHTYIHKYLCTDNTVVNRVQDSYYDGGTLEYQTNASYMHAGSGGFRVEYVASKQVSFALVWVSFAFVWVSFALVRGSFVIV